MKSEKLQNAIGLIDEALCEDAENNEKNKKSKVRIYVNRLAPIAAVLVILIAAGAVLAPFGKKDSLPTQNDTTTASPYDYTLPAPSIPSGFVIPSTSVIDGGETPPFCVAKAHYPAMAQYPDNENDRAALDAWAEDIIARRAYLNYTEPLDIFSLTSMQEFLTCEGNENLVYSPVNLFMALSMCAELSSGNTQKQILDLLGAKNVEDLRNYAYEVWNGCYCDDGTMKSVLANSMWLNEDVTFNEDVLRTLAQSYYASTFSGKAGSEEFSQALRDWTNEQTGNLLKDEVNSLEITPETIMSLVSTIYFRAKWDSGFSEKNTKQDIFYSKDGEITCDFMNTTYDSAGYFWGENFSATSMSLSQSSNMWFVLPDEGVEINDLIKDPELQAFLMSDKYPPEFADILSPGESIWEKQKALKINLSLPKFDTKSTINLKDGLENLGVTECFDPSSADFSALTSEITYLSSASHSARVTVDEEGVIATAFTALKLAGSAIPQSDEIDFILNRPFLFFIENGKDVILFCGVVNNP